MQDFKSVYFVLEFTCRVKQSTTQKVIFVRIIFDAVRDQDANNGSLRLFRQKLCEKAEIDGSRSLVSIFCSMTHPLHLPTE